MHRYIIWIAAALFAAAFAGAIVFFFAAPTLPELKSYNADLRAAPAPEAPEKPDFVITGAIGKSNGAYNGAPALLLSLADLKALPQHHVVTDTQWTEGEIDFSGPLARDVLAFADVAPDATEFEAVALNKYSAPVPIEDALRFDVIFALARDGAPLSLRDKGPAWVVYPRKDFPILTDSAYATRWVWQLERIEVK